MHPSVLMLLDYAASDVGEAAPVPSSPSLSRVYLGQKRRYANGYRYIWGLLCLMR